MLIVVIAVIYLFFTIYKYEKEPKLTLSTSILVVLVLSLISTVSLFLKKTDLFISCMMALVAYNELFIYLYCKESRSKKANIKFLNIYFCIMRVIEIALMYVALIVL